MLLPPDRITLDATSPSDISVKQLVFCKIGEAHLETFAEQKGGTSRWRRVDSGEVPTGRTGVRWRWRIRKPALPARKRF